ncbi:unnamed protein product, partial [Effrenium voratum]
KNWDEHLTSYRALAIKKWYSIVTEGNDAFDVEIINMIKSGRFEPDNTRALAAGLDVSLVEKIQAAGMTTIAKVAFCSSYLPGSADESPMVEAFKCAIGRDPVLSELAAFRLLFHECYAIVSQEMKVLVERSADSAEVRRLTNVERADRYDKQVKRLCGITIKDHV